MLNKVKHLYTDSSLTLRMTGSVNMYIIPIIFSEKASKYKNSLTDTQRIIGKFDRNAVTSLYYGSGPPR